MELARSFLLDTKTPALVFDNEGDHHVDLILDDRTFAHVHLLLLDPRASDVAQRFGRPDDSLFESILEALARGRSALGNLGYRHLIPFSHPPARVVRGNVEGVEAAVRAG